MFKLSIVIPVFNKYNFTKSCLNDLFQLPDDHQIIIVDDGSSDETQKELSKLNRSNFKYIRNTVNAGFAKSCNLGYKNCNSDKVMFLNNDIKVRQNHISWTQDIIDNCSDNVLVGPTGGYVDPSNKFQFAYETGSLVKKINYMSGWCISGSTKTWKKLIINKPSEEQQYQVFSEEFGKAYFEDTDLGFRATKLGIDFKLVSIPVVHFGKISSKQINTAELYSNARKIFINKWSKK